MMTRSEFRLHFRTQGPVVLPVIHVLDAARTNRNIEIARKEGAPGVFLINHDFGVDPFLPIITAAREANPDYWIGVNFLAVTGAEAFPRLGALKARVDAYWADDARIDEADPGQPEATEIARIRERSGWKGLYFGGTAFKKQREVAAQHHRLSASEAARFMDVITTSGVATGEAADLTKISDFRAGIGDRPLAIASGITPENARLYRDADCFMVATGINVPGNFYDIDPERLRALMKVCEEMGEDA